MVWGFGGLVELKEAVANLSLTGFNGRCDGLFFTQDPDEVPDNSSDPMTPWRQEQARVVQESTPEYDLTIFQIHSPIIRIERDEENSEYSQIYP